MSIFNFKYQVSKFVNSDEVGVMVIKGGWGVGKTHTWNEIIKKNFKINKTKFNKYSYVSLFGINSVDDFKYSVFKNIVDIDFYSAGPSVDSVKKNMLKLWGGGKTMLGMFNNGGSFDGLSRAAQALGFMSVRNTLLCIDDLERKGQDISIKDILGLACQMKEQKSCKIVILINDGEEGIDDYHKYKEKVVDVEVLFDPTPEECFDFAYCNSRCNLFEFKEEILKFGIKNIRILKKIERLYGLMFSFMQKLNVETSINSQVICSISLFSLCYYSCKNNEIPTLDFVLKQDMRSFIFGDEDLEAEDKQKESNWRSYLRSYDFQVVDDLDIVVAEAVKSGYFVEDRLECALKRRNIQVLASKSNESFNNAWDVYHNSFNNNEDEVVDTIFKSIKKNIFNISPRDLNSTVILLRSLGNNDLASDVIDYYIKYRSSDIKLFDLADEYMISGVNDSEIISRFKEKHIESVVNKSPFEILVDISNNRSWNEKDIDVLSSMKEEDYYDLFKSINDAILSRIVTCCLQFGKFSNSEKKHLMIYNNAVRALNKISSESNINKLRIAKFNIK